MRRSVALAVVVLVPAMVGAVWGAEAPAPSVNVIHATGHAVVELIADAARVECSVRTRGKDAAQAEREAASALQQLRDAVTGLNLPGMTLRDTGVSVSMRPDSPGMFEEGLDAGGPPPGGRLPTYVAAGALIVTVHAEGAVLHKQAGQVVVVSLGATGPNLVRVTPFYLKEDDSKERQQAWEQAVLNAVANAQALARGLGVTVAGYGSLSMLPTAPQNPWEALASSYSDMGRSMADGPAPDVRPLQVDVTVYLDAMYE